MKNTLKVTALALAISVSFAACKGSGSGSSSDSGNKKDSAADTATKKTVDTLKKDTIIKNDSAKHDTTIKTEVKTTTTKKEPKK